MNIICSITIVCACVVVTIATAATARAATIGVCIRPLCSMMRHALHILWPVIPSYTLYVLQLLLFLSHNYIAAAAAADAVDVELCCCPPASVQFPLPICHLNSGWLTRFNQWMLQQWHDASIMGVFNAHSEEFIKNWLCSFFVF